MEATLCRGDTQKKKPRIYRVMLHNDTFNKREYVVAVLLRIIKSITVDDAVNVMQASHSDADLHLQCPSHLPTAARSLRCNASGTPQAAVATVVCWVYAFWSALQACIQPLCGSMPIGSFDTKAVHA